MSVFSGLERPALSNAARRWSRDALPSPSRIRVTKALRPCVIFDMLVCLRLGGAGERPEETSPVAFRVEDAAHLITACAIAVETPMLKLNARTVLSVGNEAHLDFRIKSRIGLPIGADVPRKHQP